MVVSNAGPAERLLAGGNRHVGLELAVAEIPADVCEERAQPLDVLHVRRARHFHRVLQLVRQPGRLLRLVEGADVPWQNRVHFYAVSAQLMRRILIDHARERHSQKRGGDDRAIPSGDWPGAVHARGARRRGARPPAPLRTRLHQGAYAVASLSGEPLLAVGRDFGRTDIDLA